MFGGRRQQVDRGHPARARVLLGMLDEFLS
jgi:hypothetical protein